MTPEEILEKHARFKNVNGKRITEGQCQMMRDMHENGETPGDIEESVKWSRGAIRKHVNYRCKHGP